jgi:molecular chaperone DnaK
MNLIFYSGKTQRIRPVDIQAMVLKNMRESAERLLGHSVTKAVITVPAYFNSEAKAETMEAARIAGFDEGSTLWLHEPTAAAYYYGYCAQKYNDYRLLVFDLGGGTFDVTILHVRIYI